VMFCEPLFARNFHVLSGVKIITRIIEGFASAFRTVF